MTIFEAMADYAERFGDTPTVMGLPENLLKQAAEVLTNADHPLTDEEFYHALGVEPPPDDVEV